jgi:ribose 5-phosphate isomerase A
MDILEPISMEKDLNQIPGVLTVGLFAMRSADLVLVSSETEVYKLKKTT